MARHSKAFAYQSIPDVGPYGTATNRGSGGSGDAEYYNGMGGLFAQGFLPSSNPPLPSYMAPSAPSSPNADPIRDAIAAELMRQRAGDDNQRGPGTSDYADTSTPSFDAPQAAPQADPVGPFGEDSAGSGKGISPAQANAAARGDPPATAPPATAPPPAQPPATVSLPDVGKTATDMDEQQATDPGTTGVSVTMHGFTPSPPGVVGVAPPATQQSMTQAQVNALAAQAQAHQAVMAPFQSPYATPTAPDAPDPADAPEGPTSPSTAPSTMAMADSPDAVALGKGINEALASLNQYNNLDTKPAVMMDLNPIGIQYATPTPALNTVNPAPPVQAPMTMEQALHAVFGDPAEPGWSFGKSSPQSSPDDTPSFADAGITAAPGETLGNTATVGQIAGFGDALAGAEAAQAAQGAPSGDAPSDTGVSFGGTSGDGTVGSNVGGSSLGGSAAAAAGGDTGDTGGGGTTGNSEAAGGLGGSNAGEGGGGPW